MLTVVMMCQQGIPFRFSPARAQMIDELIERGSNVIVFFPGSVKSAGIRKKVKEVINTKGMKPAIIRKKIKDISPDILISFTIEDVKICFSLPYTMKKTDFYYYNLEIYVGSSAKKKKNNIVSRAINRINYIYNKLKEIVYVQRCCSIVVQDRLRKKILKKHWISHPVTWLIPNSYCSIDYECNTVPKKGIIFSGSVGSAALVEALAECSKNLKDIEITISGWNYVYKNLKKSPNINIIKQDLSQEEYTRFISAYDMAIVWYADKQDDNSYNIGLASGKFFKHLSIGQPVIANRVPGLAEEIEKYHLGVVIDDIRELPRAVNLIYENYEFYTNNIKRIYVDRYDFHKVSKRFFDLMISKAVGR